ncbi:leucine rich repeat and IQ motif containing 1 [Pitangus sulphuratus]|nr:leucine rich repeat and IQ motif containing 1 [Pitangus sulphuratus]
MSEDIEGIEKEIEIELGRISVTSLEADDPDTEASDETLSDSETISDGLPESVLSYLNFMKSSNQDAEKLILQDLEDEQITNDISGVVSSHTSESNEDPEQFKEKMLLEIENEVFQITTTPSYSQSTSDELVTDDHLLTAGLEMSISPTHHEVEEKCRQELELEDKRKKWKAERELREKQNEEHARRMRHLKQFEAERVKLDLLHKKRQAAIEDELQKEKKAWRDKMMQHEELIMKLQMQMKEEKKALEEQKAKERQQLAEKQNMAAVKIQARFRSFLVHKKYAPILKEWKYEMRKKQKMLEEIERERKEREEKLKRRMEENRLKREEGRKRQEELERQEYLERMKRHEEYEKKKESLRLEREKQLQVKREEQTKLEQKKVKAMMSESGENNKENIKNDNHTENTKVIREQRKELNKQGEEQKEKHAEMMDGTNNWTMLVERNLTPTPSMLGSEKEHSSQVNNENIYMNSVTQIEENCSQTSYLNEAPNNHTSKEESLNFGANDMVENKAICSSPPDVQPNTSNREIEDQFCQYETTKKTVYLVENANEEVRDTWDRIQDVAESSSKLIFPDDIEKKRINWMTTCKSWSKIYEENQRKQATVKKRPRKSSVSKMPPLSAEKIIHSGPWSTLQQENNIQIIDCENLENLCVLILSKNHLSSVCGLDGCKNLQNLELSYNRITRFGGLESLKNLQQLTVDHNQLISTKGLCEVPTLIYLDCSFNHLTQVEDIENCGLLQVLKLQGNNLQEVLPSLQSFDGEILTYHTLPTTERIKESELRTFLELCQLQIEENIQLKKKAAELEIASSIDSAQGQCWYFNQLMKISIKHRYAHEYGELYVTDRDGPEALQNHLEQTSTGCLQENNLFIMGATENKQVLLDPSKRWIATGDTQATFINSSIPVHQKENKEDQIVKQKSTESCINYSGESKGNNNMSAQLTSQQSVIGASTMERNVQHFENHTESYLIDILVLRVDCRSQ